MTDKPPMLDPEEVDGDTSLRTRAIKGAKWSILEKWAVKGLSLVVFVVLGRLVAPQDFGLIALATVTISFFQLMIQATVSEALVQAKTVDDKLSDTAFWLSAAVGALMAAVCWLIAPLIAAAYDEPDLILVLRVLSVALFIQPLNATQVALLRRSFDFRLVAIRRVLAAVAGGLAGVIWAFVSPSVWALVAQYLAASIVSVVVLWAIGNYRPHFSFTKTHVKWLVTFGLGVIGIRVTTFLGSASDSVVIGALLGSVALGYYVVGFRIFKLILELITNALAVVALPSFSRLQHDHKRMVSSLFAATRVSAVVTVPLFLGTAVIADHLIPLLFGDKWDQSIPVMQVLSLVGLAMSVTAFDKSMLIGAGFVRTEMYLSIATAVTSIVSYIVGAQFGIVGVAVAYTAQAYLLWPVRMLVLRHKFSMSLVQYVRQWYRQFLAGGAMVLAMLTVRAFTPNSFDFPAEVVTGLATYTLVLWLAARSYLHETVQAAATAVPQLQRFAPRRQPTRR